MNTLSSSSFKNSNVLLRVDYNVSFDDNHKIANLTRITQTIPTIKLLLKHHCNIIIMTHLGQPKGTLFDASLSTFPVAQALQTVIRHKVTFVPLDETFDFAPPPKSFGQIYMIENVRFFKGEIENSSVLARKLAALGDVYVNDAFGVCHRKHASVVAITKHLPSYAGLLLEHEVAMLDQVLHDIKRPFVAVLGGAKLDTKLGLISKLAKLADLVLLGGKIGQSDGLPNYPNLVTPQDYITSSSRERLDIGPKTVHHFIDLISNAKTILWNGPMGKTEDPRYARGTHAVYSAIVGNSKATSVIGGGDTITSLTHESHLDHITHISTGGGACLQYIEDGTLPGIEALRN